jgi:hypothetical protein
VYFSMQPNLDQTGKGRSRSANRFPEARCLIHATQNTQDANSRRDLYSRRRNSVEIDPQFWIVPDEQSANELSVEQQLCFRA